jgi:hypothetical protein
MSSHDNPARTLALLRELVAAGLSDAAFSILHHFKEPETIARHRSYCESLKDEGGRFRTNTNRLVQRRLELVLNLYQMGKFTCRAPTLFEHLAHSALLEYPHDTRSLEEQYEEN